MLRTSRATFSSSGASFVGGSSASLITRQCGIAENGWFVLVINRASDATRSGAGREDLRDHAAHRRTDDVRLFGLQMVEQGLGVVRHVDERVRNRAVRPKKWRTTRGTANLRALAVELGRQADVAVVVADDAEAAVDRRSQKPSGHIGSCAPTPMIRRTAGGPDRRDPRRRAPRHRRRRPLRVCTPPFLRRKYGCWHPLSGDAYNNRTSGASGRGGSTGKAGFHGLSQSVSGQLGRRRVARRAWRRRWSLE